MANITVSSVLEKFTAMNDEFKAITEQAQTDLKEYNDYCDSSDEDLSNKLAELREKIAKVEAHLEYAREHATDLEEAEMPFETEPEQLSTLHRAIDPSSSNDPNAETLYTKASAMKMYYDEEVERTKKKILGSKVQAKRLYDSQVAEIEERKKKNFDEFKEYTASDDFKAYIKSLSKDAAAFNSSGKSNLPVGTEISIGQRRVKLPVPPELDEELSLATGGVFNSAAKTIGAPYSIDFAAGKVLYVDYDQRNESYMLGGIQRLILNILKYYETTIEGVFYADAVHLNSDCLGHIVGLTKVNNPIIEPVCDNADVMLERLKAIKASLTESSDEQAIKRVFVFHGYPDSFSAQARNEIIELVADAKKYKAAIVITHDCSNESDDKSLQVAQRAVQTDAEIIRSRNGGFYVEKTHDSLFWYSAPSDLPDDVRRAFIEQRRAAPVSADANNAVSENAEVKANVADTTSEITKPAPEEEFHVEYRKGNRRIPPVDVGDQMLDVEANYATFISGAKSAGRGNAVRNLVDSIIMHSHPDDVELWLVDFNGTEFNVYDGTVAAHIRYLVLGGDADIAFNIIDRLSEVLRKRIRLFAGHWDIFETVPSDVYMPELICVIEDYSVMQNAIAKSPEHGAKLGEVISKGGMYGMRLVLAGEMAPNNMAALYINKVDPVFDRNQIKKASEATHRDLYEDTAYSANLMKSFISKQTLVKRAVGNSSFAEKAADNKKLIVPLSDDLLMFLGSKTSLTPDEPITLKTFFGENILLETPAEDVEPAVDAIVSAISSAMMQECELVVISSVGNEVAKILSGMEKFKDINIITDIIDIEEQINKINSAVIHRESGKKFMVVIGADNILAELATIDMGGRTNYVGNFIYILSQALRIGYHFMLQISDREITPEYKLLTTALRHQLVYDKDTGVVQYKHNEKSSTFVLYSNYQSIKEQSGDETMYLL